MSEVIVRVTPRTEQCTTTVHWDPEAYALRAAFSYASDVAEPRYLWREQIEQMAGVIQHGYRIEAGALEISLDPQRRIASIELRTNPISWLRSELPQPPGELVDASVEFLVEYDSNGIASISTPVRVAWDAERYRLSLRLGTHDEVAHWYLLGTDALIGVAEGFAVREFRFSEVQILTI